MANAAANSATIAAESRRSHRSGEELPIIDESYVRRVPAEASLVGAAPGAHDHMLLRCVHDTLRAGLEWNGNGAEHLKQKPAAVRKMTEREQYEEQKKRQRLPHV